VPTYHAAVRLQLHNPNPKIGTPVIPALGNAHTNLGFSVPLSFRVMKRSGQTDRGTDEGRSMRVLRPIRTAAQ